MSTHITPQEQGRAAARLLAAITTGKAKQARLIISPKLTMKLTQQKHPSRQKDQQTYLLTVGRPNHTETLRINTMVKRGDTFPKREIELKEWPKGAPPPTPSMVKLAVKAARAAARANQAANKPKAKRAAKKGVN